MVYCHKIFVPAKDVFCIGKIAEASCDILAHGQFLSHGQLLANVDVFVWSSPPLPLLMFMNHGSENGGLLRFVKWQAVTWVVFLLDELNGRAWFY